jgi:hypothetical protein
MASAYEQAGGGRLADRLLAALDAAEAAGGDVRGRQSAALLVVPAAGDPWSRRELRVEDSDEPLVELRRLVGLDRAYAAAGEADERMAEGDAEGAQRLYEQGGRARAAEGRARVLGGALRGVRRRPRARPRAAAPRHRRVPRPRRAARPADRRSAPGVSAVRAAL